MSELYPLKFKPLFKERIWGGSKLHALLGKDFSPLSNCGESWEISGLDGDVSVVANGTLAGNDLEELIEIYMGDLVGEKVYDKFGVEFPLLIKFLDANDELSIQVHPDDKLSKERHNAYGKTEMWYVVQADKGAKVTAGFNQDVDRAKYLRAFESDTLIDLLNVEEAKAGDVFFIPSGSVHTIGKGLVVAEVQQTSDVTYRIYDFNRKDSQGNSRELHTELSLDAIDFTCEKEYKTNYKVTNNSSSEIVFCQYFTTNVLNLTHSVEKDYNELDSFIIYMCLEGAYAIGWGLDNVMQVKAGETILVPASIENFVLIPREGNSCKLLEVYIK